VDGDLEIAAESTGTVCLLTPGEVRLDLDRPITR
jgi:hypothetical protein